MLGPMSATRIRQAEIEDAAAIARIHVAGWQAAYRGILPDAVLDALDVHESETRRRKLLRSREGTERREWVLEVASATVGWAATGPARDEDLGPEVYELAAIYLDPTCIALGLGRELMAFCIQDGVERGYSEMIMWVLSGNERANRFYAAAGFKRDVRVPETPFRDTGALKRRLRRWIAPA